MPPSPCNHQSALTVKESIGNSKHPGHLAFERLLHVTVLAGSGPTAEATKRDVEMIIMDVMLSSPLDKKNRPPRSFLHVKQSEKTNQSEDVGIPVGGHGGPFRLVLVGAVAAGVFPRLMSASPASLRDARMRNHWTCPPGRMAGRESGKGAVLCRRARLNGLGGFPRETTDRRGSTWRSAAAVPRGPSVPLHCGVPVLWCSGTTHWVTRARPARR